MPDRLSALDASYLYLEDASTPMHVGSVAVFRRPKAGFDYDRLVDLVEQRLSLAPRYRRKVVHVPGRLARPVWVDDQDFDVTYHVRRSALPTPGTDQQLHDLVGRLMSRPLDNTRPLWEAYLVEGLARNRIAVVTKTHQAMVDGVGAPDITQVMLDVSASPRRQVENLWMPQPEPSGLQLVVDAVAEAVQRPGEVVENARSAALDTVATVRKATDALGGLLSAVRTAATPAPGSPLNVRISSPQRRFAVARTRLDEFRAIRRAHGGTVNDGVLAALTGALRAWLLSRGEVVSASTTMRAMTPMSVRSADGKPGEVSAYLVDLPVGEPNPVVRLHHVSHATRAHQESAQKVAAQTLVRVSGFAPPTLHALGARAASSFSKRLFNVVVTNVPGPQVPLYASGARMTEMFPVVPLARSQALAIGVTSYDGGVYFGLNADRDAMPDVDVLAGMVEESVEELMGTVSG
ncbi:WS/DGAT/MGAT family O-acyltransferase [Actinosynnema mirum]|uniref:Diacylglycerol O-acyltransferase n=1 Tax=Actinosynnema mirum (strain ATCC 29888 / DSM 43827 / JCM 3225 / NBRC 14064 / NCIMB 13271 / NRRL B-12336 / IMRU 3971 / 101) TaxID=446462 RepID=C6WJ28_ACTMD|nr:wax ester/triacylglycerol synthase family O-acyltransferase [Actinosynnema mirum]ACU40104.1 acyltransferase, WS/DGAT/MGAT [Actinosynnema mirum DSM 43827]